jgi:hypothetical protein
VFTNTTGCTFRDLCHAHSNPLVISRSANAPAPRTNTHVYTRRTHKSYTSTHADQHRQSQSCGTCECKETASHVAPRAASYVASFEEFKDTQLDAIHPELQQPPGVHVRSVFYPWGRNGRVVPTVIGGSPVEPTGAQLCVITRQVQRVIRHDVNITVNVKYRQRHKVGPCVPTRRGIARQRETPRDPTRQETAWRCTPATAPTACVRALVAPLQQLLLPHACPRTRRNSGLPSGVTRCL